MSIARLSPNVALNTKLVARPDAADEVDTFLADAVRLATKRRAPSPGLHCVPTRSPSG